MKRSYLALGSRIELYYLVSELVELGLSYRQIQQAVLQQKHAWLSKSTISYWARRIHNPLGKVNQFQSGPSPELAYVIGVVLGDGNLNIHGYIQDLLKQHRIETSRLYLRRSAGTALLDPESGKVYFRRKDGFSFIVRTKSLPQFAKEIGFSIERRQRRLCEAARRVGEKTSITARGKSS